MQSVRKRKWTRKHFIVLEKANLESTYKQCVIAKGAFSYSIGFPGSCSDHSAWENTEFKRLVEKEGFWPEGCAFLVTMHI